MSKVDKTEINAEIAASIKNFSQRAKSENARWQEQEYIEMPEYVRQKAQMISAHFLLPAGAKIVDMGCESGEITYMLAALNPHAQFIGVDIDAPAIDFARRTYVLPNLTYMLSDLAIPDVPDESLDGIVNSNILHHIYSSGGYDPSAVEEILDRQVRKLKTGGTMLVRDYVMPPLEEFVLLEMPAIKSLGADSESLSDPDLLVAYSQGARPMSSGAEGFYIEERPPLREGTRLFYLPHKWALEFVHRKNYRTNWESEMKEEYTFFTWQDYKREFTQLGMRMVFSAPYWNPWVVKNCFKGRFQMYTEAGEPMEFPATNHFIVAQKVADKQSLLLEERRPSTAPASDLRIMVVRDKKTGTVHEMVKRPGEHCDIVPWRVTADNRLVMYVRGGYPRPIVNAVQRGCHNLDGKKWSGHLIEPISMDTADMTDDVDENRGMIFSYAGRYAGVRAKSEGSWYLGDTYYPSPDRIDEAIEPVFIEVENPFKTSWPIAEDKDVRFIEPGLILELDAADIILASQVGLLPEPRLEMYAFELMARKDIPLPRWIGEKMPKLPGQPPPAKSPEEALAELEPTEFEEVRELPTQLKAVRSVFVEEGKVGRVTRGLSAQDIEFVVTDDGVENIALVAPLSRDWDNNLLLALEPRIMPAPNRLGGTGAMMNLPSFVLPKDVKSVSEARLWVAAKFRVPPENVGPLGESYFTHTGVTPQRIYPFFVASARGSLEGQYSELVPASLVRILSQRLFNSERGDNNMAALHLKALARISMMWMTNDNHALAPVRSMSSRKYQDFALSTEKTALEAKDSGYAAPSRILGQRGAATVYTGGGAEAEKAATRQKNRPEMWQAAEPTPQELLAKQGRDAQRAIEMMLMPRIGKRLTQSYAQALDIKESMHQITLTQTPSVAQLDRNVGELAEKLKIAVGKGKSGKGDKGEEEDVALKIGPIMPQRK
jgi:ubiquinone/menaquinone biosynthesis C-methylase UbiE